ncbi:PAS domain-containing protein [Falsiroseomonas sp. E2-1-a20]|uniref:PAS domain-containing protein n=1 Tax=Falsiroseomonas sp. E2-1-a20 TaxID=3239300 RepID=UPI003F3D2F48
MQLTFSVPDLLDWLESASATEMDALSFGVVAMTSDGKVVAYNQAEAAMSGLTAARVIGRHFFSSVAPCTNNYLVAQLFEAEQDLDQTIDYVFTLRMVPTQVHLRMLKHPNAARMYLLVQRRKAHVV